MLQLNSIEIENLKKHYHPQVELVKNRLAQMGASMPDPQYKSEGTFYVVADFSDLLGTSLPSSTNQALGKKEFIETDEDIIYFLLFTQKIMLAPLSYFGINPRSGFVRITCGEGDNSLTILMDRIENCLALARTHKKEKLTNLLRKELNDAEAHSVDIHSEIRSLLSKIAPTTEGVSECSALELKQQCTQLKELYRKASTAKETSEV